VVWSGIGTALVLAGLDLLGLVIGIPALRSLISYWPPMSTPSAVCLLLSGAALGLLASRLALWKRRLSGFLGLSVGAAGFLSLTASLVKDLTGSEWPWAGYPVLELFLSADARMAALTALYFLLFGTALLLLGTGRPAGESVAAALLLGCALLAYQVLAGYLLDVEAFHRWLHRDVAFNTGLALAGLLASALHLRPDSWLMRVFTGPESGAQMARRLLPALVVLPLVIGWLRIQGERRGVFESDLGVALVALTYASCFLVLTWLSARSVNRLDRLRREAEETLRQAHADLERRVRERTAELGEAASALESEKKRFKEVLDVLPAYVILLTPDHHVALANRFFEERFGRAQGRRCYEYLFGRTEPCETCETFKPFQTGAPHHWEWTGPDGRIYDVHDFPFADSEGATLILEMGVDITARKRAESELERHRGRLEDLVDERTAALTQALDSAERATVEATQRRELLEAVTCGAEAIVAAVDGDLRYTFFNQAHQEEIRRLAGREIQLG
jgi:PAS domain-containing protein